MPHRFALATVEASVRGWSGAGEGEEASAAVATVLRDGPEGAEMLLIRRAERDGDPWSGHVAFPGGKREREDASLLVTATRETAEEVGLRLAPGALLGRLPDVNTRSLGVRVAQFVFSIADPGVTFVTSAEVTGTLWLPLERLLVRGEPETMPYVLAGTTLNLPCVRLGESVLWGMTYRMAMQLVERLRG